MRRRSSVKNPLEAADTRESEEGRQNTGNYDFAFFEKNKKTRPEKKYQADACFEYGECPVFDSAMSQDTKGEQAAKGDANGLHRLESSEPTGTSATSSIQAMP